MQNQQQNRKNIFLSYAFFLLTIGFAACSGTDDSIGGNGEEWTEVADETAPNPMESYLPLDSPNKKDPEEILGYGYDITGKVSSDEAVRGQIINLDWTDEDARNSVQGIILRSSYSFTATGVDKKSYIQDINRGRFGRLNEDEVLAYHAGTLLDNKVLNDPENKYSYRSEHSVYEYARFSFIALSSILDRCQTTEFQADADKLSVQQLIEKYGTHFIHEIKIGSRLDMLYRSEIKDKKYLKKSTNETKIERLSDETKLKTITAGTSYTASEIGLSFMHWSFDPEYEALRKRNINPIVSIEVHGGDKNAIACGTYNLDKKIPVLDQKKWVESLNDDNYATIFIDGAKPLYTLLKDQAKRAELRDAINAYIASRQIQ